MQRFIDDARKWADGARMLHVYIAPRLDHDVALRDLADRTRSVIRANFTHCLAEVPDEWLHATGRAVAGIPAADITTEQRARFTTVLTDRLAEVPAFTATAGPPMATMTAVLLDIDGDHPDGPWTVLSVAISSAIDEVFGAAALAKEPGDPHLTIGYGTADGDSGRIQAFLRRQVRPSRAALTVDEVFIVDVEQDAAQNTYRWETVSRVPLRRG